MPEDKQTNEAALALDAGPPPGGEMAALVWAKDWSKTPLGPVETWSPSLKIAVSIVLASGFPMALRWGPEFVLIYNNGYRPILGDKHPWALGRPGSEVWAEVWPQIGPVHTAILSGKRSAIFAVDLPLTIQRHGCAWEEARFTLSYSPTPDDTTPSGVGGIFITAVETTERVEAEHALRLSEEKLRQLNQTLEGEVAARTRERDRLWRVSQDLLGVANFNGNMVNVNPAWTTVLGWSEGELLAMRYTALRHPEDHAVVEAEHDRMARGLPARPFDSRFRHKDGSYRWFSWRAVEEDGLVYVLGRDITAEREAAEALRRTEEALRQAQKMEAVGQLTGGIAHDFNNLLTVIFGNLEAVQRRLKPPNGEAQRLVGAAMRGAERAAVLTQRLLAFSRRQPLDPKPLDLNKLVAGMSDLLRRTLGEGIAIETVLAGGLWRLSADANQLESALLNLAVNARDAMPEGGKLTIETANTGLDEGYAKRNAEVIPGRYVMIAVSDTGVGMSWEVAARVFEPFFTTKELGQGTGLGLSQVYGFVKQSGGHAKVYSEPGRGTTVRLYLPRLLGAAVPAEPAPEPGRVRAGATNEIILVVEDDADVRAFSVDMLRELGYPVLEASDGAAALGTLERAPGVRLLFTDLGLPGGLDGRRLAEAATRRHPQLKVLFTTGYARDAVVHDGRLDPGIELIVKPFTYAALAAKIRHVLDGA